MMINAKLKYEIRQKYLSGLYTHKQLIEEYNTSSRLIGKYLKGINKTWVDQKRKEIRKTERLQEYVKNAVNND